MQLLSLKAEYFKNYDAVVITFSDGINCFVGKNGAGKTNLLDAIYVLCSGKSYFNLTDQQLIKNGEMYFSLRGTFLRRNEETEILIAILKGKKKAIKRNNIAYGKVMQHYGEFPAVIVAPGDIELIMGGSEERRRWLDSTLSLLDKDYLLSLMRYEKVLQQRNAELKNMAQQASPQNHLIQVYNAMLAPLAETIFSRRNAFLEEFMPWFQQFHKEISGENESVKMVYESDLQQGSLQELLDKNFRKDVLLQRTTKGTHKDDLVFLLEEMPLRKYGSQGQQKTFLLAIKLAQHQYIKDKNEFPPLLLLDDVCERLDEKRLEILFSLIQLPQFGQVFVTDSSAGRLQNLLQQSSKSCMFFAVENGKAEEFLT